MKITSTLVLRHLKVNSDLKSISATPVTIISNFVTQLDYIFIVNSSNVKSFKIWTVDQAEDELPCNPNLSTECVLHHRNMASVSYSPSNGRSKNRGHNDHTSYNDFHVLIYSVTYSTSNVFTLQSYYKSSLYCWLQRKHSHSWLREGNRYLDGQLRVLHFLDSDCFNSWSLVRH